MDGLHKIASEIQNKLKSNYIDLPNHSHAKALVSEVEKLIVDVRQKKNPLSIENRIKEIIKLLEAMRDDSIMDFHHRDELLQHSNKMRDMARQLG